MTSGQLDDLSTAIRARRRERRLTQEELAHAVGVSASYIAHIELGRRRPSVELLAKIGDTLWDANLVDLRPDADGETVKRSAGDDQWSTRPPVSSTSNVLSEQTVMGSVVASAVAEEGVRGPTVLAVLCERGHPNALYAVECRVCGDPMSDQPPVPVSRPSLGALRYGDLVVHVVRGAIIGRAPDLTHDHLGELPELVVVRDNPLVSRNHLQISVDGWVVLARDLGSANGTTLTLPGRAPERMSPTSYYVLLPGSVLSLADEVTFTFESEPSAS